MEKLPTAFVEKIKLQFPNDFEQFLSALNETPKTGILINHKKKNINRMDILFFGIRSAKF